MRKITSLGAAFRKHPPRKPTCRNEIDFALLAITLKIMEVEVLREAVRRQPFKPFTVRLSDGRALPVRHPEFLAVGQSLIILINENDTWSEIDPFLIVSLDYNPPTQKKPGKR